MLQQAVLDVLRDALVPVDEHDLHPTGQIDDGVDDDAARFPVGEQRVEVIDPARVDLVEDELR